MIYKNPSRGEGDKKTGRDMPDQAASKEIIQFHLPLAGDSLKIIAARAKDAGFDNLNDYARHCLLRTAAPAEIDVRGDRQMQQLLGQHGALSEACDKLLKVFHGAQEIDASGLQNVIDRYWDLRHDLDRLAAPDIDGGISFEPIEK
jgi:hypothetical protein